jgi:hypothetical protein
MYKTIPQEDLPQEYGGFAGPIDKVVKDFGEFFYSNRQAIIDNDTYGTDESKRVGKSIAQEDLFGVDGSFRKLEID